MERSPDAVLRPKRANGKKRRRMTLVFDEDKRREFLIGFHKRKVQRQKKSQEKVERQFKEERKKIRQNAREQYKKLLSSRDVPELERLLSEKEYEMDGRTVSVLELDVANLTESNQWIGDNMGMNETASEFHESHAPNMEIKCDVHGMSLRVEAHNEEVTLSSPEVPIAEKKDLKCFTKRATLDGLRKSKVFWQKQKLDSQRNKKQIMKNNLQNGKLRCKKAVSSRVNKKFKKRAVIKVI